MLRTCTMALIFGVLVLRLNESVMAADVPEILLWSGDVPGPAVPPDPPEKTETGPDGLTRRFQVSKPRLFVHLPSETVRRSGAAVVVVPGGGFGRLADEHEGADVCRWLAGQGITAFQLAYRTPTSKHAEPSTGPVLDAQMAVMEVRRRSADFGLDSSRIGLMGFSAGGQVSLIAASSERLVPENASGAAARVSHRPDVLLLIYPYRIFDPEKQAIRADVDLDSGMMPVFLAQMGDDTASLPEGSARLYAELVRRKVPAELHIYERGGHGFGMRPRPGLPGTEDWSHRAASWLTQHGWIVPPK